jgi:hypothetical protein
MWVITLSRLHRHEVSCICCWCMRLVQAVFIRSFFTLHKGMKQKAGSSITSLLLMALYGSGVGAGFLKARDRYHALNPTAKFVLNGQPLSR